MTHEWISQLVSELGFTKLQSTLHVPPSPEDIQILEQEIGGALPEAYQYFAGRWGGGYLGDRDSFVIAPIKEICPWGDDVSPETWHPFDRNDALSLESLLKSYSGRIPKGVLPFVSDAFGNEICLDVSGSFPGSVWFWDHEQGWFVEQAEEEYPASIVAAAREIERKGVDTRGFSIHDVIRSWARLHASRWDRPPDYMGMYRMADSFADFLRSLRRVRYDVD